MKNARKNTRQAALIRALGHPVRQEILVVLARQGPMAPRDIAEKVVPRRLSNVSYHMRVLAKTNTVKLVRTEPVRGSVAHFYRFNIRAPWALDALGLNENGKAARA